MTATTVPAGSAGRTTTSVLSRIYGLGSVYAKTLRDSRLALIIVCGLIGSFLLGPLLGAPGNILNAPFNIMTLIAALIGSIILLAVINLFRRGKVR